MTSIHEAAVYDVEILAAAASGAMVPLPGRLVLPEGASGLVLFAHGSGSSRSSPRNTFVASVLHEAWIGTLLFDLLTPQEATERTNVFDIRLLADRLHAAIRFAASHEQTRGLRLGLFGASTGAAAALVAAAEEPAVKAVVSRGGRPDLAAAALRRVHAPTLLIVGSEDVDVLQLNEQALEALGCEKQLAIIPGASHLFEEPGTLEEAARLAAEWCGRHVGSKTISGGRP